MQGNILPMVLSDEHRSFFQVNCQQKLKFLFEVRGVLAPLKLCEGGASAPLPLPPQKKYRTCNYVVGHHNSCACLILMFRLSDCNLICWWFPDMII